MENLFFNHIVKAPEDPIFSCNDAFIKSSRPEKVNLSVGLYFNRDLVCPIFESVKVAEQRVIGHEKSKGYLAIDGDGAFIDQIGSLVFGEFFWKAQRERICGAQTAGGTAALRVLGEFLKQEVTEKIGISDPTYTNHKNVFARAGMIQELYPYYDFTKNVVDFDRLIHCLSGFTPGMAVLLQPCCHNPTGADLTLEQWKEVSDLCHKNGLLPFFDMAYQGLGTDLATDSSPLSLFAREGHEMLVAASLSKNFGLYSERVGLLFVLTSSKETAICVQSKIKGIIRGNYSNPPGHGAKIVVEVLSHPELRSMWEEELGSMRQRVADMRKQFSHRLMSRVKGKDFSYILRGRGLFCLSGLEKNQVEHLKKEHAIFVTADGRMNVTGLNQENVIRVADAMVEVL